MRSYSMMGVIGMLAGAALCGPALVERPNLGRTRYGLGGRPTRSRYMPRQGERECARRVRQAERNKERQLDRVDNETSRNGFGRSRRGLLVDLASGRP